MGIFQQKILNTRFCAISKKVLIAAAEVIFFIKVLKAISNTFILISLHHLKWLTISYESSQQVHELSQNSCMNYAYSTDTQWGPFHINQGCKLADKELWVMSHKTDYHGIATSAATSSAERQATGGLSPVPCVVQHAGRFNLFSTSSMF